MAQISASQVKQLRDMTGAGMGACKNALVETGGDLDKAVDLLRAKGVKADQATRVAAEGAVRFQLSDDRKAMAILELRCETDFAARSEGFQKLVALVADEVLKHKTASPAETQKLEKVASAMQEANAITIRENIVIAHAEYKELKGDGRLGAYVHHNGQVGVAVAVNTTGAVAGKPELDELLKEIAMHATAHHPAPVGVDKDDVPADLIEREKAVAMAQIDENPKDAAKPQNIKEKMVEGRLRKFFEEQVLLEQKFVKDPELSVRTLLEKKGKELGGEIKVAWFVRRAVGS